jgi:hypothetical protein
VLILECRQERDRLRRPVDHLVGVGGEQFLVPQRIPHAPGRLERTGAALVQQPDRDVLVQPRPRRGVDAEAARRSRRDAAPGERSLDLGEVRAREVLGVGPAHGIGEAREAAQRRMLERAEHQLVGRLTQRGADLEQRAVEHHAA